MPESTTLTEAELTVMHYRCKSRDYELSSRKWVRIARLTPKRVVLEGNSDRVFDRDTGKPVRRTDGMAMYSHRITNYR